MIQSWNLGEVQDVSGLADLLDRGKSPIPNCVAVDDAAAKKYASRKGKELWQHVVLHSGADPDWWSGTGALHHFTQIGSKRSRRRGFAMLFQSLASEPTNEERLCENLSKAEQALRRGEFRPAWVFAPREPLLSLVRDDRFSEWALKVQLPVIGPWPLRSDIASPRRGEVLDLPRITPLLQALHATAWHIEYERARRGGDWYPKNEEVSAWAVEHLHVTRHIGDAIATMIRDVNWKRGAPTAALAEARKARQSSLG